MRVRECWTVGEERFRGSIRPREEDAGGQQMSNSRRDDGQGGSSVQVALLRRS